LPVPVAVCSYRCSGGGLELTAGSLVKYPD
jgi:hypothetical protein